MGKTPITHKSVVTTKEMRGHFVDGHARYSIEICLNGGHYETVVGLTPRDVREKVANKVTRIKHMIEALKKEFDQEETNDWVRRINRKMPANLGDKKDPTS